MMQQQTGKAAFLDYSYFNILFITPQGQLVFILGPFIITKILIGDS